MTPIRSQIARPIFVVGLCVFVYCIRKCIVYKRPTLNLNCSYFCLQMPRTKKVSLFLVNLTVVLLQTFFYARAHAYSLLYTTLQQATYISHFTACAARAKRVSNWIVSVVYNVIFVFNAYDDDDDDDYSRE